MLLGVFQSANSPAYLKVGAISGILRHVEINRYARAPQIAQDDLNQIESQCISILQDRAAGQDQWPQELNYWLKRRSAQMMGATGRLGDAEQNLNVLVSVLAKPQEKNKNQAKADGHDDFWLRYDALAALSNLDLAQINQANIPQVMDAVTTFSAMTLESEAEGLREEVENLVTTNILFADEDLKSKGTTRKTKEEGKGKGRDKLGGGFGGLEGGESNNPPHRGGQSEKTETESEKFVELPNYRLDSSRQRIKTILQTAQNVFVKKTSGEGLAKVAADKEKTHIMELVKTIEKALVDSDLGLVNLKELKADEKPDDKNITNRLAERFEAAAAELRNLLVVKPAANGNEGGSDLEQPSDAKPAEKGE